MAEDGPGRRARAIRKCRRGETPQSPADHGAEERHRSGLRHRDEMHLPAAASEPGQPLPGRLDVAPHPDRGEHGEGEEKRGDLAADEQKAPAGDLPGLARSRKLGDRG